MSHDQRIALLKQFILDECAARGSVCKFCALRFGQCPAYNEPPIEADPAAEDDDQPLDVDVWGELSDLL